MIIVVVVMLIFHVIVAVVVHVVAVTVIILCYVRGKKERQKERKETCELERRTQQVRYCTHSVSRFVRVFRFDTTYPLPLI